MASHANPIRIDMRSPGFIVQKEGDVLADVDRALPKLAPRVHDRCVVSVRAVVIERSHDISARRHELGKPGVVESVAAMTVREHDERTFYRVRYHLRVLVKVQVGEENHACRHVGFAKYSWVKQREREMPVTLCRIHIFELFHPDRIQSFRLYGLRERHSRPRGSAAEQERHCRTDQSTFHQQSKVHFCVLPTSWLTCVLLERRWFIGGSWQVQAGLPVCAEFALLVRP